MLSCFYSLIDEDRDQLYIRKFICTKFFSIISLKNCTADECLPYNILFAINVENITQNVKLINEIKMKICQIVRYFNFSLPFIKCNRFFNKINNYGKIKFFILYLKTKFILYLNTKSLAAI